MTAVPAIPVFHFELPGVSFVPIAVSGDCQDRSFATMAQVAKAGLQIADSTPYSFRVATNGEYKFELAFICWHPGVAL